MVNLVIERRLAKDPDIEVITRNYDAFCLIGSSTENAFFAELSIDQVYFAPAEFDVTYANDKYPNADLCSGVSPRSGGALKIEKHPILLLKATISQLLTTIV